MGQINWEKLRSYQAEGVVELDHQFKESISREFVARRQAIEEKKLKKLKRRKRKQRQQRDRD